ncbi:MAG: DUF502 domain-containing protein [Nitrospinae bacterium]|nr:DUF502 domain-containing protein [Nitrospinota bacterium]
MNKITRYFFEGLLLVAPVAITLYVILWIMKVIDQLNPTPIPGMGLVFTFVFITLAGFFASNYLARAVGRWVDALFARLPFIKMLYQSIKDLMEAFVGGKKSFDKPVLVTLAPGGASVIGFMTLETLEGIGLKNKVAVYLPQSYNFAGNLIVVSREQVTPIDAPSGAVMALVVSGGISSGNDKQ